MSGLNDPNDPKFAGDPDHFVFVNGQWQYRNSAASGNAPDPHGTDHTYATNIGTGGDVADLLGLSSSQLPASAPGGELPTLQGDDDRMRMGGLLAQLQGQAATGSGAWEQALAQNTNKVKATASALGQSAPGVDPMTAARNIGNAQAGADQRAVGQGNLLRAQTQQAATGQLADIYNGQQALDSQRSAAQGAARQGRQEINSTLQKIAGKNAMDITKAGVQGVTSLGGMSEGGAVPGTPRTFGDDEANDVVPAKLSPGEIVIPRSITTGPDAPAQAAAFVQAVLARGTPPKAHFDAGGQVNPFGETNAMGQLKNDPTVGKNRFTSAGSVQTPASYATGSLLEGGQYNETRDANLANTDRFAAAVAGRGPSTAPQAMQNAQDSTIADAMRAQAGARHPLDVTGAAAEQEQGAAGNAAGIVAGESQRGGAEMAQALQKQRAQDIAFAQAQQQAAWRNSMLNAGVGLEQQAQLRSLLGAAGQGAVSVAGMFGGDKPGGAYDANASSDHSGGGRDSSSIDAAFDGTPGDYDVGPGGYAAEGGVIVSHLARQGTRKKPMRPEKREKLDDFGAVKGGMGSASEWRTYDKGSEMDPRTQREADGTEQYFADGGPVFYGTDAAQPQPGPFAANTSANGGSFLDLLSRLTMPGGGPSAEERSLPAPRMMTPEEIRAADARNARPPVMAAPVAAPDTAARERPFIAKPAPPAAVAPAPASKPAPMRPAATAPKADPYALAQKAGEEKAAVEGAQADETTQALQNGQRALEENAIAQNESHARASAAAHSQLQAIQKSREELKKLDTTVDTGHFWESRSVPGKIAAVIGLVLGAVGNDNGVNRASMLLDKMIDRDIDAQKASHEMALRKGQSDIDTATNIYGLTRQMTQDDIAANAAAKGTALDLVKNQVDIAAAKAGAPMAKANLSALSAELARKKMESDAAVSQRGFDNSIKKQNADSDRMRAEADMAAAGNKAAAGDKTQAALLAQVGENYDVIQKSGVELKALIKKYGTGGGLHEGKPKMQQLINDIATARAKLNDPSGQARASEVEAEARNFFQPGFLQSADTANKTIDAYLANSQKRRDAAFKERGQGQASSPAPSGSPQVGEVRENSKTKKRIKWTGSEWAPL